MSLKTTRLDKDVIDITKPQETKSSPNDWRLQHFKRWEAKHRSIFNRYFLRH
jgi:hypothetical protein